MVVLSKAMLLPTILVLLQTYHVTRAARATVSTPVLSPCHPQIATVEQCLAKMSLDQKIGQMSQIANVFLTNPADIATLGLGKIRLSNLVH